MNNLISSFLLASLVMPFNILVAQESSYESKLKRLFTTVKQRLEIDRLKKGIQQSGKQDRSNAIKVTANKAQKVKNRVKVTGLVKKDNGLTLVWIKQNGQLKLTTTHNLKSTPSVITGEPVVIIKVDNNTQNLAIKPGQTWLRDQNKVYDDWQLSSIQATETPEPETKSEAESPTVPESKSHSHKSGK